MNDTSMFKRISIGVIVVWLVLFVLIPNLLVIIASFLTHSESQLIVPQFSLESYLKLFDPVFFKVFLRSFYIAAMTTLITLILAYPFAALIAKARPTVRKYLLLLVIIPFWTSSLIRTYALIIIMKTNGLLNKALLALGIIDHPLRLLYTDTAVFVGLVYALLPFMILPLYATIEKFDPRLIEAAKDLGANSVTAFFRVVLPITMPGIIAGCMLVFLPAMGLFYIPDLLGGAKSMLLGNMIKDQFLVARDWPFGSAASVILTLLMGIMLLLYTRSMKKFNRSLME